LHKAAFLNDEFGRTVLNGKGADGTHDAAVDAKRLS